MNPVLVVVVRSIKNVAEQEGSFKAKKPANNALATDRPTFAQIRWGVACEVGQNSG